MFQGRFVFISLANMSIYVSLHLTACTMQHTTRMEVNDSLPLAMLMNICIFGYSGANANGNFDMES